MEGDSRILVGKSTTCWSWGQISPPIPSQATKLSILKPLATGAQGTPIPQKALRPLEKESPLDIPKFRVPASDTSRTYTLSLDPASPSRSSPLRSHPPLPPLRNRGRAAGGGGGGARTCPRRPRPDKARESGARTRPVPSRSRQHSPFPWSPAEAQAAQG